MPETQDRVSLSLTLSLPKHTHMISWSGHKPNFTLIQVKQNNKIPSEQRVRTFNPPNWFCIEGERERTMRERVHSFSLSDFLAEQLCVVILSEIEFR